MADWRTLGVLLAVAAIGCTGDVSDDGDAPDPDPRSPDAAITPNPGAADAMPGANLIDAAPVVGEPPELVGITNAHNTVRAGVGVAPLVWDNELAAVAQGWADQCIDNQSPAGLIDHNPDRSASYPGYVGENVYGHSGQASGTGAVMSWASEVQYYDYPSNSCDPGRVCGHYTQIVWAASQRLGCGYANCKPELTYGSTVVCNYSPGGNNGNSPY